MTKSIEERFEESFKYGGNSQYLDHLYEQYIQDPSKIKPEWKDRMNLCNEIWATSDWVANVYKENY